MVQDTTVLSATQIDNNARTTPKVLQFLSRRPEPTKKKGAETWSKHNQSTVGLSYAINRCQSKGTSHERVSFGQSLQLIV